MFNFIPFNFPENEITEKNNTLVDVIMSLMILMIKNVSDLEVKTHAVYRRVVTLR